MSRRHRTAQKQKPYESRVRSKQRDSQKIKKIGVKKRPKHRNDFAR